jgi:hypothetical protein
LGKFPQNATAVAQVRRESAKHPRSPVLASQHYGAAPVREMNRGTWDAIARRQAWYVIVLEKNLAEWPKDRIDACTHLETLRSVLMLAKRVDRHEQLMIRHLSKGVAVSVGFGQDSMLPSSLRVSRKSTHKNR